MELQAKWIWAASCLHTPNCYVYTRREFEVANTPCAEAFVSCTGEYKLYVNGRYIGRGANYGRDYDTHDLSHVIRTGKNVIAAICYNPGREDSDTAPAGFILHLQITHNGDSGKLLATDETWKTKAADEWDPDSAPICAPERYQEIYDSRRKPVGWNVVGFDDGAWPDPAVRDELATRLAPRQIPPLREHEVHPRQVLEVGVVTPVADDSPDIALRMYAESTHSDASAVKYAKEMLAATGDAAVVTAGGDSYVVLDFGAEIVGHPCLKIRGGGEAIVDIGYSEILDANGRVWPTRGDTPQADRLVLHGGRQDWQSFGRRVFRYVQLTFRNVKSPISVESLSAVAIGYPVEQVSTFECSDDLLNKIWQTGVYTLGLCMQNGYESSAGCSVGRISDARLQALFNYYCFSDSALAAQTLAQITDGPQPEDEASAWVEMLHDYYCYTGDLGLVTQLYPHMSSLVDSPPEGDREADSASLYQALRTSSKLAAALSNTEDARRWHESSAELQRAFISSSDESRDRFACVDAVLFGLADAETAREACLSLSDDALEACYCPSRFHNVLQVMAKLEMNTEALDLIRNFWGWMLNHGATTWWVTHMVGDDDPVEGSLCCGASAAPTYFLPAEILGVKPSTAGAVTIQPRVADLAWAKGHIKTPAGYVDVEWHSTTEVSGSESSGDPETQGIPRFTIDIEAPPGFIVALPIAHLTDPIIDEIDLTPETPERRARKTYGWGTTIWRSGAEHDPYLDWLSSQSAEPPAGYAHRDRCAADGDYVWVRESVSNHVRYEIREGNSGI